MSDDKKLNEVIRVQKRPSNFVMMDKGFLENSGLSWKAKGMLAYLLSKPDNWKVIVKDLVSHSTDGKSAIYSGLNELKELGHYQKIAVRDESGRRISHWEGTISEVPMESLVNTPFSLLPDFQEIENQDIDNQDIENRERNNNYINNNNFNNNQSSQVQSERTDETDTITSYARMIKGNIDYDGLTVRFKDDIRLIDDFISIMLDVLLTESKYILIGGENKPRELVKHNLLQLAYDDIEHAIEQFKSVTGRITKKKQYIIAMLYNCKMETDAHYTNLVQSDLWNS